MNATEVWIRSGMAADAAQDLAWFVILIMVGIGVMIWRDSR